MGIFSEAKNELAFAKVGLMGFAGSGKTYTASRLAMGLHKMLQSKAPVFFLDTETGSDWMIPEFRAAGIPLHTSKVRAFEVLRQAITEVEKQEGILIIDSITHFWRELCDSYMTKRSRQRMEFQDWAYLKRLWAPFTDQFLNSRCHIFLCGRAGFEYDYFTDDDGKKQLEKTGIKMRAEAETGYEPSLSLLMERETDLETKQTKRLCTVLKDRNQTKNLDGKQFWNPTFEHLRPHFEGLNIGGTHKGVDTSQTSEAMIGDLGRDAAAQRQEAQILLDEIETLLVERYPSQKVEDKSAKIAALKMAFGTASWERIKTLQLQTLRDGLQAVAAIVQAQPAQTQEAPTTPAQ